MKLAHDDEMSAVPSATSVAASSSGSTISVHVVGQGRAPVFAVSGLSGAGIEAGALAPILANADARCTLMDIAGSGRSRHPGALTMDVWLEDIESVFRERVGTRAIWIGQSIGGWLMTLIHRRHPEWFTAMCALAPAFDWDTQYLLPNLAQGRMKLEEGLVVSGSEPVAPASLVASMERHRVLGAPFRLDAPLHVIFGGKDETAPAAPIEQFLRATTGARATADFFRDLDHSIIAKLHSPAVQERFSKWLDPVLARPQGTLK